jgi:hypothetical protein
VAPGNGLARVSGRCLDRRGNSVARPWGTAQPRLSPNMGRCGIHLGQPRSPDLSRIPHTKLFGELSGGHSYLVVTFFVDLGRLSG